MHYFKRNIGDYHKKAGRLSMLEHGAYTLLIDSCYDREKFPSMQDALEWTWARTPDEIEAVRFVLGKFFTLENGLYVQNRIKEEIENYHNNSATNRRIALEREERRRTNRGRTVNEPPPNQEPRTKNQEPLTNINPPAEDKSEKFAPPISAELLKAWKAVRKAKRGGPITELVWKALVREADKAGISPEKAVQICCEKSWQNFDASWNWGGQQVKPEKFDPMEEIRKGSANVERAIN